MSLQISLLRGCKGTLPALEWPRPQVDALDVSLQVDLLAGRKRTEITPKLTVSQVDAPDVSPEVDLLIGLVRRIRAIFALIILCLAIIFHYWFLEYFLVLP